MPTLPFLRQFQSKLSLSLFPGGILIQSQTAELTSLLIQLVRKPKCDFCILGTSLAAD
ncbi:hypothetical protein C8F04DRAFT_1255458 [Mycena alexandri]|uniref:Uncharacterized protein n=1 Tax=Mycena alexandri TaxID=1745969 RepID=A0AAD6X6X9_9AGAR|nr:hypothetical protein C8F04DRAFT_1255458 [Mycena alexandri]